MGTRLLHRLPQQATRLRRSVLEAGELGIRREELRISQRSVAFKNIEGRWGGAGRLFWFTPSKADFCLKQRTDLRWFYPFVLPVQYFIVGRYGRDTCVAFGQ